MYEILIYWAGSLLLFIFIYRKRSSWLKRSEGIYKSWANYRVFLKEHHRLMEVCGRHYMEKLFGLKTRGMSVHADRNRCSR
jgi:hypothetical protein